MIEFRDVSKVYPGGVAALQDVTLTVERGDIFGVIGVSGAGKSTLLRLVNGLETPTSGSVMVDGLEIPRLSPAELRKARAQIGIIFQHFHLLWSRTVRENVAFPLEIAGLSPKEIRQRTDELLERVGLADKANSWPSQLSGGQKQRVGIARALANRPKVLLCDEATSALDPETTASILALLKEIHADTGITMMLITHEMSVVRAICNRMAVMEAGRVVETGSVRDIFKRPSHPLTRRFLETSEENGNRESSGEGTLTRVALAELTRLKERGVTFRVEGDIRPDTDEVAIRILDGEDRLQLEESGKEECSRV
ncbi:ATP-binding cassette domain-containing protein [Staphylospora marina]|uniref:methionine ABC transporter ATP-binding protein n=1 Tax=Staphylospora marina TaxID=2490858 RepID=UPI000F5BA5FF